MLEIYKFESMTTPCELQLYCDSKEVADSCAVDIMKECKRLEQKYNYYSNDSYLHRINSRQSNTLDSETKSLLSISKQYYKKTNGLFDITIATLKDIYQSNSIKQIKEEKTKLLEYTGCEHFSIKKNKINFTNEFTKIDFGGLVKEYSVDRAVKIIKKYKIKSALVNFGGDIYAHGRKPNNEKFNIGITNPIKKEEYLFNISIENQALTTSASYERNIKVQDEVYSHIISKDKKSDILSATVVSNSCVQSGVYSTALMCNSMLETKDDTYIIDENLEILR
ncbi:MAG TPA: FAD:protein FMN transferase [Arcobacter sp.]|nr:FAD:protein FMN transferase [Arcobacter sp.]